MSLKTVKTERVKFMGRPGNSVVKLALEFGSKKIRTWCGSSCEMPYFVINI